MGLGRVRGTGAPGLLGDRRASGGASSTGIALARSRLTRSRSILGGLLLAQPVVKGAATLALAVSSEVSSRGSLDLSAIASSRAGETSRTRGSSRGARELRRLGGSNRRFARRGGLSLTAVLVVSGTLFDDQMVILLASKEHTRLDRAASQRLDAVQDVVVAIQQIGTGSEQAQLVVVALLVKLIELVEDLLTTAAGMLEWTREIY